MKMNLSVVMGVIDRVSGPLKGMTSDSDHYAKKINEIKKAQSDDGAALHLIDSYKAISKEIDKSALSLNEAKDKLAALQAKETSAANAKKTLNAELEKQTKRLAELKAHSEAAGGSNKKLNKMILEQSQALEKLRAKAIAASKPNVTLAAQLARQADKVAHLTRLSDDHNQRLTQVSNGMKKAGIDASKLDDEFARLSTSYDGHAPKIDKLSKQYKRLQTIMSPFNKVQKSIKMPSIEMAQNGAIVSGAALGSIAGFGAIIADTAAQVNELSRAAKDVAMPVDDLQAMRLQAKGAGAEAEDMDAAIKEMNLRWAEMKTLKSGAMNDYFKDTGNGQAYKDLMNAKSSMEAYQVLLREIAKETDVSKQNFMADEFFGGDSEKMLSVLKAGTDGLNKAKQDLEDTGGPISQDSIDSASEFESTFKKLSAIINSLKISALTPIMKELSIVFGDIAEKMKNMDWRAEAVEDLRQVVSGVFAAFKAMGGAVLFMNKYFSEIVATIALVKIAFFALNAVMFANPIGMIVAGVMAAGVAITYLVSKFVDLGSVMSSVGNFFGFGDEDDKAIKKVDEMTSKIDNLKGKSIELGVTTNKTTNRAANTHESSTFDNGQYNPSSGQINSTARPMQQMAPLTTQHIRSQSEVALTIKSDKPVTVDKVNSDKGTNLNIDVGNMMMSY